MALRRLYLQVYLTIVASLFVVILVGGALWQLGPTPPALRNAVAVAADLALYALPPASAPSTEQQDAVSRLAERMHLDLALYADDRQSIAFGGEALPPLPDGQEVGGWMYGRGAPAWAIQLADGRWLIARAPRLPYHHPALTLVTFLGTIAFLVALSAYPIARRLSLRLERLQSSVERLGEGDLAARVKVEGRDEVARLAQSFNKAAARIEELVRANKMLLANASHELRTPISRIRLGIELMKPGADPARAEALERDIKELDELIDEILLASRLDATRGFDVQEDIDLLGLAAEVAARYDDVPVSGQPVQVRGDPRLLRRLTRNLLENAHRHGAPLIEVNVHHNEGIAVLSVTDAGDGIPASEEDRIFEPFHSGSRGSGTGLGLALVRQIARKHGGDVSFGSPPGKASGSHFMVTLPAVGSVATSASPI
jgi:signal transduction histidine kinase